MTKTKAKKATTKTKIKRRRLARKGHPVQSSRRSPKHEPIKAPDKPLKEREKFGRGEAFTYDVVPADLIDGGRRQPWLRDIYDEIDQQWPQGRDPRGNGYGSRIGTLYIYFDTEAVLHIHFSARGAYLLPRGGLRRVPMSHLPGHDIAPIFNVADTPACSVGELLVNLHPGVDPNHLYWIEIAKMLREMTQTEKQRGRDGVVPKKHRAKRK